MSLEALLACGPNLVGKNRLHDPHTNKPDDGPSAATLSPVVGGRFVRFEYSWTYQGAAQEGLMLIGFDAKSGEASAYWIDTWHMTPQPMMCKGTVDAGGTLNVFGNYAGNWGWRTILKPVTDSLTMAMYNVTPEGREEIAVEAVWRRK